MRFPLLAKAGPLAMAGIVIMACLARIDGLTQERRERGIQAVQGVERSHAASQTVMGPILSRTCFELWDTVDTDAKDGHPTIRHDRRDFTLTQVPAPSFR